jgi:endonuclease/exonuclease/phosphatase family metal-dependent hydrolase
VVRIATLNLLHGLSPADGRVDAARLRGAIASLDADVLCLQEVDRDQPRSGHLDLTAIAAEALGARWSRFEPALAGTPGGHTVPVGAGPVIGTAYGIAIVSRMPVRSWHTHRLAAPRLRVPMPGMVPVSRSGRLRLAPPRLIRDEPRVLLAAVLDTPNGLMTVGCAHLTFVQGWNVPQLRAGVRLLRSLPGPRLLLGDLNMPSPLPAALTRWHPLVTGRTFPSWRPRMQIDHVLADGPVQVTASSIERLPVSDHCAVTVDISDL